MKNERIGVAASGQATSKEPTIELVTKTTNDLGVNCRPGPDGCPPDCAPCHPNCMPNCAPFCRPYFGPPQPPRPGPN